MVAAGCNGMSSSSLASASFAPARAAANEHADRGAIIREVTEATASTRFTGVGMSEHAARPIADAMEAPRWTRRDPSRRVVDTPRRPASITVGELLATLRWNKRVVNELGGDGGEDYSEDYGADVVANDDFIILSPRGGPATSSGGVRFEANSVKLKRVRAARRVCLHSNPSDVFCARRRHRVHGSPPPALTSFPFLRPRAEAQDEQAQAPQAEKEGEEQEQVESLRDASELLTLSSVVSIVYGRL